MPQSPSSPVSVFDFSSFMQLRQEETARLEAPSVAKVACAAPPLESITTASSSSLSSISTRDQEDDSSIQVQQRKRSIFSHYWKKTGEKPIEMTPSTEDSSASVPAELPQSSSHERLDQLFPQAEKVTIPPTIPRRSIMGERASSYSNPSFSTLNQSAQTKKSVSSSELEVKRSQCSQSCLRESRFSGSNRRSRSNSCSSAVDFSERVDVVIYEKPVETYSEEGWSRFFSI